MVDRKVFVRLLLTIGLPIVLQQTVSLSLNMIDTFMIGSVGVSELAAAETVDKTYFMFSIVCFGIYNGSSIYVSQYWGIRGAEDIRRVIAIEVRIGFFLALFTVGLALVFAPQILHLSVRKPDVVAIGASRLRIIRSTYLMTAFFFLVSFNSHATHNLKAPTLISVLAITVNTVLDYGLIFDNFHLPRLGVEGAAIAMLTIRSVEMLLILGYVYSNEDYPLTVDSATIHKLDAPLMERVVETTLPAAMSESVWNIETMVCFIAYGLLGTSTVVVVQMVSIINDLSQCVFFGLGNACAVMTGNKLGRNHTKLAYPYERALIGINIGFYPVITAALLLMKDRIVGICNYDATASRMLNPTLIAYALYTTPEMVSYVHIYEILRSGDDTKFCMLYDLIGIWCATIPMSSLAAVVWRLSLHWVVALPFSDEPVRAVVTLRRFRSKKQIHVLVRREQECEVSGAQCLRICYYIHIKSKGVIYMNHLPAQKTKYVTNLFSDLFLRAYRIKSKKAEVAMDNLEHLCHVGSTIVFRNEQSSRRLISQYFKLHPQLPKEDTACIARSQGCRKQQPYVMMHEQEYTFVLDRRSKTLYGVKGTTDSLSFLLRSQTLSYMVQHTALPYKNHFILGSIRSTQTITNLSFIVELFEEYCGIAMEKGALLSEHETASFSTLERNMQEKKEGLFSDHLNPLNAILWNAGQDQKNSFLELTLTAWNLGYGSDKQVEEFSPRDVFRRYVKPLIEYRRMTFANAKLLIDRLEAPLEKEACMRVVGKKEVEQLKLEL